MFNQQQPQMTPPPAMPNMPTSTSALATPNKPSETHYAIEVNGKIEYLDRITTVLGATKAKDGLLAWYSVEERKRMIEALRASFQEHAPKAKKIEDVCNMVYADMLNKIAMAEKHAAEEKRDDAADLGKVIHAMIERYLVGTNLAESIIPTAEAIKRYNYFLDWARGHKVAPVPGYKAAEHTVHSETLMVAGTLDWHLLVDGQETIGDHKTGKNIYRDAAIQVAIYTVLEREGRARANKDVEAIKKFESFYNALDCPPIDWPKLTVFHIPTEGLFEYEINRAEAEDYVRCFLGRLRAFRCDAKSRPFRRCWPKAEKKWLRLK